MTTNEYQKIQRKLQNKKCPICAYSAFQFYEKQTSLFVDIPNNCSISYENIDILNANYIYALCEQCGYEMKFNIQKLIR